MNSTTRTLLELLGILIGALIFTGLAYFICTNVEGHALANASKMPYSQWEEKFISVLKVAFGLTLGCSLVWYLLAKVIFSVQNAAGSGRRTFWVILLLIVAAGNFAITNYYAASESIRIQLNFAVTAIFILCFAVGGYWLTSIFTTPSKFKYTPIAAQLFRKY